MRSSIFVISIFILEAIKTRIEIDKLENIIAHPILDLIYEQIEKE